MIAVALAIKAMGIDFIVCVPKISWVQVLPTTATSILELSARRSSQAVACHDNPMKQIQRGAFALLPIFGLVYFSLPDGRDRQHDAASGKVGLQHGNRSAEVRSRPLPKPVEMPMDVDPGTEEVTQLRGAELREAINASMAKVARAATPEIRREVVKTKMRTREPAYRSLFSSWKLGLEACDQVLEILHARENQKNEALHQHDLRGMEGGRDYVKAVAAETAWAESQLVVLLGPDRVAELSRLEAELDSRAFTHARRIIESGSHQPVRPE